MVGTPGLPRIVGLALLGWVPVFLLIVPLHMFAMPLSVIGEALLMGGTAGVGVLALGIGVPRETEHR